jgi:hypothetical protein
MTEMTYSVTTPLHFALWEGGGEIDVEAVIRFTVTPGAEATQTEPGYGASVEVRDFRIRKPKTHEWLMCPAWIVAAFVADDSFNEWLISEAAEQDQSERDAWAEAEREDRGFTDFPPHSTINHAQTGCSRGGRL